MASITHTSFPHPTLLPAYGRIISVYGPTVIPGAYFLYVDQSCSIPACIPQSPSHCVRYFQPGDYNCPEGGDCWSENICRNYVEMWDRIAACGQQFCGRDPAWRGFVDDQKRKIEQSCQFGELRRQADEYQRVLQGRRLIPETMKRTKWERISIEEDLQELSGPSDYGDGGSAGCPQTATSRNCNFVGVYSTSAGASRGGICLLFPVLALIVVTLDFVFRGFKH